MKPENKIENYRREINAIKRKIVACVEHPNEDQRLMALELIDNLISNDLLEVVRKATNDKDELVRSSAIEILGSWNDKKSTNNFIRKLSDRKWLVRISAAESLAQINAVQAIGKIEESLLHANEEEKYGLYFSLALFGKKKYFNLFLKGISTDNYRIRCATANRVLDLINSTNKSKIAATLRAALKTENSLAAKEAIQNALSDLNSIKSAHKITAATA